MGKPRIEEILKLKASRRYWGGHNEKATYDAPATRNLRGEPRIEEILKETPLTLP